ncbi:MAG: DUF1631 family protein [Burkholderiales bacterium]
MRGAAFALRGQIRDYCRAGLYIAFDRPLAADELCSLPHSAEVRVEFQAGTATHAIAAKVARALPTGLGLQVAALPDAVMAALQAAGTTAPAATVPEGPDTEARRTLQQDCHRDFGAAMNGVLKMFFDSVSQALIAGSGEVGGTALRSRFTVAARELASERPAIAERFGAALRESLRDPLARRDTGRSDEAPAELSLVDDDQFEEWLSLSTVVHQIESDLSMPLADLERRYGALRGLALDRVSNPFGPATICRAFQDAIAPLKHPAPVRTVEYRCFGAALRVSCASLYATLNAAIAPLDAPAPTPRRAGRAGAPATTPARSPGADATGRGDAGPPDDPAGTPGGGTGPKGHDAPPRGLEAPDDAPATPVAAELVESLQGLYRSMQAAPVPANVDYSLERLMKSLSRAGASRPAAAQPVATHPVASPSAPSLLGIIDHLAHGAPAGAGPAAPAPAGPGPARALRARDRVLDAYPTFAEPAASGVPPPTLSAQLVGSLDASPLPATCRRTLESAAGLLGRAVVESGVDSEIHWLLRRLERPLLKLALRDASFLGSADHAARRMVDLLEQYSIATDEQGRFFDDGLRRYLHQLVERVAVRGEQDPSLFERARDVLSRLLAPIRETRRVRVARLQEACEARDRVRRARLRVADALAARLGGRRVPETVLRLLDAGWRQHLVLLEMRGASDEFDEGLAIIDRLLEWLGPDEAPGPGSRSERTALVNRLGPALAAVCVDPALRDACVADVERVLAALERREGPPPAVFHPRPEVAPRELPPVLDAWTRRLRTGDWWLVPREGRTLPMQLIWTSRPAGVCAFASRSATDCHELTLVEFAREIEAARIRPVSDQDRPLLERSEFALLDERLQALLERALQDPVSGLTNRKGFVQRLERLARSPGDAQAHVVGVVEFDALRIVWSACGVDAGEALVRELAHAARECLGEHAVLASLRDDTFALLLPGAVEAAAAGPIEALRARLADHRFEHSGQRFSIGICIGLAQWTMAEDEPEAALRRADTACVAARAVGRNRIQVWTPDSRELRGHDAMADWAGRIDALLEGDGLFLRAQEVRPIADDALDPYYEILLGIEPQPGLDVEPTSLVTAIERLGRSAELDLWVMREVLDWVEAHPETFARIGGFAINVSPLSLGSPEILRFLDARLARPGVPAGKLTFELTETAAIDSYGAARDFIQRVRRHGCRVSLDDFGSGYASYSHLKNLRTDSLKIDGAFVRDMLESPSDRAMVKSMHEVARSLGIRTVAEYVESPAHLEALREIGIDYAQGYAIHKPARLDTLLGD